MIALKNNKIKIFTLIVAVALVFAGCGSGEVITQKLEAYESSGNFESSLEGVIAENDNYQMLWDDTLKSISVLDKSDGSVFTTNKYEEPEIDEYGIASSQSPRMLSDIIVEYTDPESSENDVL